MLQPAFSSAMPHVQESQRLETLRRLQILDTRPEPRFDRLTQLVSKVLEVETVLISLVDERRQWFKSICNLGVGETSRDVAFCAHAINESSNQLVIPDATKDPRFAHNPLVVGAPKIRAYAGVVLRASNGLPLGTLCTIAYEPREFSEKYLERLSDFAELVGYELRRASWGLDQERSEVRSAAKAVRADDSAAESWLKRQSFGAVMAMRDTRNIVAATVTLPRVESLARAYGNPIVDDLMHEVERRLRLVLKDHPHHLEMPSRGLLKMIVAVDKTTIEDPLAHIRSQLLENLGQRIQTKSLTVATPVRIGLSQPATESCGVADLLSCSEIASEHITASHVGPSVKYYEARMGELAGRYHKISGSILRALETDQFEIHYQPKVHVGTNCVVGLEALIRWQHPELGVVSPPEMLQVLGDLDRIPSLDYWLIGNVCDQIRRWSAEGKELVPVSVNICGTTLLEPDFPEKARALVADRNVRVDLIEFELLESVVVDVASSALDQLERCRALGFSIALDDFGAGQTSLSYLARLPVDTVKIDRSFVDGIVEDTTASNLLFRIISMCKSLGKITIVEGVESVGQYLLLRSFHCDQIQGYYFAKPEPVAVTGDLLTEQNLLLEPQGLGGL